MQDFEILNHNFNKLDSDYELLFIGKCLNFFIVLSYSRKQSMYMYMHAYIYIRIYVCLFIYKGMFSTKPNLEQYE
jgi:hypothetical protein